jgi:hypothetical protein
MADLYVSDSTYAAYVSEYGDDAKDEMRSALKSAAPNGDTDE